MFNLVFNSYDWKFLTDGPSNKNMLKL